jgi:hypothetical protein
MDAEKEEKYRRRLGTLTEFGKFEFQHFGTHYIFNFLAILVLIGALPLILIGFGIYGSFIHPFIALAVVLYIVIIIFNVSTDTKIYREIVYSWQDPTKEEKMAILKNILRFRRLEFWAITIAVLVWLILPIGLGWKNQEYLNLSAKYFFPWYFGYWFCMRGSMSMIKKSIKMLKKDKETFYLRRVINYRNNQTKVS